MKRLFLANGFLLIMACGGLYGQAGASSQSTTTPALPPGAITLIPAPASGTPRPDEAPWFLPSEMKPRFLTVKAYMGLGSPLQRGDFYLSGMGDEAAFYIYTYMVTRPAFSVTETLTALDIIHKAFALPDAVRNAADLIPRKALIVLKMIQATAVDQSVKERIVMETNFLATVPRTIIRPPLVLTTPPAPGVGPNNEDFK